jgi:hypothetical protein
MITDELLNKLISIQEEALRWNRLSGLNNLKTIFDVEFKTNEEKLVYELSDGEKSIRDLEKDTGISRSKVALLWRKWYNIGIMEKSQKYEGKRMKKAFSIADVGMDVEFSSKHKNRQKSKGEFE